MADHQAMQVYFPGRIAAPNTLVMNPVTGKVHAVGGHGRLTKCSTHVRPRWRATAEMITCNTCRYHLGLESVYGQDIIDLESARVRDFKVRLP